MKSFNGSRKIESQKFNLLLKPPLRETYTKVTQTKTTKNAKRAIVAKRRN
jgi:hypothetical protein